MWLSGQYQRAIRVPRGVLRALGAVAGERTSPVRMIRTALEACTAPRLSPNVSLAGVPRFIPKLHRPWPGGRLPVRANSSLVQRNAETTTRAPQRQAVTMWTRPADRVDKAWKRQRHRLRPVPALLRHPRKSVYGILRPIPAVIPREDARNNSGTRRRRRTSLTSERPGSRPATGSGPRGSRKSSAVSASRTSRASLGESSRNPSPRPWRN